MNEILDIIGISFVCLGALFFLGSTIGIIRFPDFYCRIHAAGKGDTLSTLLIVLGIALQQFDEISRSSILFFLKMLIISFFIFTTSPTATHALMRAGHGAGIKAWKKGESE